MSLNPSTEKANKKYEEYMETVMKNKFPYEYALLKSDLKTNLQRLADQRGQKKSENKEYRVMSNSLKNHLRYWDSLI